MRKDPSSRASALAASTSLPLTPSLPSSRATCSRLSCMGLVELMTLSTCSRVKKRASVGGRGVNKVRAPERDWKAHPRARCRGPPGCPSLPWRYPSSQTSARPGKATCGKKSAIDPQQHQRKKAHGCDEWYPTSPITIPASSYTSRLTASSSDSPDSIKPARHE